jgi:hypothetical protein
MGAVATSQRPGGAASVEARAGARARRLFDAEPGRVSLEQAILRISEQLAGEGRAACPVCADPIAAGRACESCGSELS